MKIKKKKIIGGALAFVIALLLPAFGFAQQQGSPGGFGGPPPGGPGHHGGGGPGGALGPLARDLNLTDAQKSQIKQITDSFEAATKTLHDQLQAAGGGPLDELKDGAFDEAAVRAAAQARAAIHVELEVQHAKMLSQVYALLTAEQKTKLAALRQKFEQDENRRLPPPGSGENMPSGNER